MSAELGSLRGVGPQLANRLAGLGIHTVQDLLFHLPLRYEDRTQLSAIGSLSPGMTAQVEGLVEHTAIVRGRRSMLVVMLADGSGRLSLRFFHFRNSQQQQLGRGVRLRCHGEVRAGGRGLEMIHPSYTRLAETESSPLAETLTPVYPGTEGIGQHSWLRLTEQALGQLHAGRLELDELLPEGLTDSLGMPGLREALDYIHRPPRDADVAALLERRHPTQLRLALEELLAHNLSMRLLRQRQRAHTAPRIKGDAARVRAFVAALPFRLTRAQLRVTGEIEADLARPHPMQRLVHGDVGSGKTVVAAIATLRAADAGYQTAVVAPTELLAEQHLRVFSGWLQPAGLEAAWLSSKVTGKARARTLEQIAAGAPLVIGTHALMQEGVSFSRLGLVIVDEQHRFGVDQRMALLEKGGQDGQLPHQLIMTATPIPRTLAMTAYAGVDVSVIDELPAGRKPVTTVALASERREEVLARVASACAEGQQAYWICTLVEESETIEAQAAAAVAEELRQRLPGLSIGLLHGRMKPAEKQAVMAAFKNGEIQLLVATTVVEVGVDVPNASLMIIENAERLGLAQLHQLRGRVGRGERQSACVLLYDRPLGEQARARLDILRQTNDGFRIAEKDLELRGPGEVLGTRQTGMLQFRVADLARDAELLERIPPLAETLLREDPARVSALLRRWVGDAARFAGV